MRLLAAREVSLSPLLPSCAIHAGRGGKTQAQLMGLQFQPTISASSTARRDFAKIHSRQLLRTLLFRLYHPECTACLPACLQFCLCHPHIRTVALLFPEVARTCSARTSLFLALLLGLLRDLPQGVSVHLFQRPLSPVASKES